MPHSVDDTSDCTTSDKGESCAAKIISEGKMNYNSMKYKSGSFI